MWKVYREKENDYKPDLEKAEASVNVPRRKFPDTIQDRRPPAILVVDDSPTVRKIVTISLGREGYQVENLATGKEALFWLASPESFVPDLILLDVMMPGLDGYDVARRIKMVPQYKLTIIVFLSRRQGYVDLLKGRLAGAKGFLAKPFTTESLLDIVRTHVGSAS